MDIEAMARAMFEAFHARFSRVRSWMTHPNHDGGQEHGRDTFRVMAQAVAAILEQPSPVDAPVAAPVVEAAPEEPGQVLLPPLMQPQQSLNQDAAA